MGRGLEVRSEIVFEQFFNHSLDALTLGRSSKTGGLATIDQTGNMKLVSRPKQLTIPTEIKYLPHEVKGATDQARILDFYSILRCLLCTPSTQLGH